MFTFWVDANNLHSSLLTRLVSLIIASIPPVQGVIPLIEVLSIVQVIAGMG